MRHIHRALRNVGWSLAVVVLACGASCGRARTEPLPPCTVTTVTLRQNAVDKVDVLFLVDNSNSMAEEQASLTAEFPRFVRVLATGDRDGGGTPELPPVRDLHVAVITSDMGNGGFPVPTCATTFGDDGILITRGNTSTMGCAATYPPFLAFMPPGDVMRFASDFACVARVGTGGCGFEQQLEAMLKALTPSTAPITFKMGTVGHEDRENAGFLRTDSVIATILVTDEEDCSVVDPELFSPSSSIYTGDLNLRCFMYPAAVHPIGRFVDGFRALRPDNPDLFVFAAITGVPTNLVEYPERIDYEAILADPRMQEMVDTSTMMTRLRPSCNEPGRGLAFPPRRIVSVAQQLAPNAVVQSICQENFGPALDAIIGKIADALVVCLPRALDPDAMGRVPCDVVEVLPASGDMTSCASVPGRTFMRMSDPALGEVEGRQVCRVEQVPSGGGVGWYYDSAPGDRCPVGMPQRIAFTGGAEPPPGSNVRLECRDAVQTPPGAPAGDCRLRGCASVRIGSVPLACERVTGSCQLPCTTDADCSGLPGFVCDATGPSIPICVNPACR